MREIESDPSSHARPSGLVCPACKGVLSEVAGSVPSRYVCERKHAFDLDTLVQLQSARTDAALFRALRTMQERREILRRVAEAHRLFGKLDLFKTQSAVAQVMGDQTEALKQVVNPPGNAVG